MRRTGRVGNPRSSSLGRAGGGRRSASCSARGSHPRGADLRSRRAASSAASFRISSRSRAYLILRSSAASGAGAYITLAARQECLPSFDSVKICMMMSTEIFPNDADVQAGVQCRTEDTSDISLFLSDTAVVFIATIMAVKIMARGSLPSARPLRIGTAT
jgi:hypothetical protein